MKPFETRLFLTVIALTALTGLHTPANAACTMPGGAPDAGAGDIIFNGPPHNVMQYCNGANWVPMSGGGGGAADNLGDHIATQSVRFHSAAGSIGITGTETDPKVGAVTNNKWCRGNGTQIVCDQDAPGGGGGSVDIQTFNSSGTWNKPGSGGMALLECWGGGGGGANRHNIATGTGGGGGGYGLRLVPLSMMGATETVTVGTGGVGGGGGSGSSQNGQAGGASSVGSHITVPGGGAGRTITNAGGRGGVYPIGDMGGAGGYWDDSGVGNTPGNPSTWGGGGGGSESQPGGVSAYGGNGGAGRADGSVPGGGGGGSYRSSGGDGADGRCIVTVY